MTNESYEQCRKTMKLANQLRSRITISKRDIEMWSAAELFYIKEQKPLLAKAARVRLERSTAQLQQQSERFSSLKFPENI